MVDVGVRREGRWILDGIDWAIQAGERWAIVGPNGSGKTTLLRVAATYLWPSRGTVDVLGARIGTVDARELRRRIGFVSAALASEIDAGLIGRGRRAQRPPRGSRAVVGRIHGRRRGSVPRPPSIVSASPDSERRTFGTLSSGERQRVLIARTLMTDPELMLLDEPAAGLDLGAREGLVSRIGRLAATRRSEPSSW